MGKNSGRGKGWLSLPPHRRRSESPPRPPPTHLCRGDFHNLRETLTPALTAVFGESPSADSRTTDPVKTSLVSSDYLPDSESLSFTAAWKAAE